MKKQILTAACALFLTVGVANAQLVIRIGPPPPRPVEVVPRHSPFTTTGSGSPAITAGRPRLRLGSRQLPTPTPSRSRLGFRRVAARARRPRLAPRSLALANTA